MSARIAPQLTVKAIALSIVLSVVLAGANAYLGLFAGLTVAAAIPAAVISMAVLKLFSESNILENNIVQTSASAGEALAAGVIFTLPALVILGHWDRFDYLWVSIIAGMGGLLGVLFTIPLRRTLIVEQKLAFPEGTATAEVLKLGEGASGARHLAWAAVIGAAVKFAETGLRLWSGTAQAATYVGTSTIAYIGVNLSPALISVGYIIKLNVAVLVFIGGAISWFVAIPIYSALFAATDPVLAAELASGNPAADVAFTIWTAQIRYLGVGAMLVGGVWSLVKIRSSLLSGIRSGLRAMPRAASEYDHTEHDAPMRLVLTGIVLFVIPIFVVYEAVVGSVGVAIAMTLIMVVTGFLFSAVGAYMAGIVGSSNSPISGVTIATILFASVLLLVLMRGDAGAGPASAILVGAVVCCAAAIGNDNMQDLAAGHIVGATPWRQQLMQCVGVVAAVLVMAPILNLLLAAYGIGAPTDARPDSLLAPQATLMASVAQGVFGAGLPWGMISWGALVGVLLIGCDEYLERRRSTFRLPVLAVAIGIYLPFELDVAIFVGGLISYAASRRQAAGREARLRNGVLFAAGLITGEALIGILMAVPIAWSGDPEVFALPARVPQIVGLVAVAVVAAALFRVATRGAGR